MRVGCGVRELCVCAEPCRERVRIKLCVRNFTHAIDFHSGNELAPLRSNARRGILPRTHCVCACPHWGPNTSVQRAKEPPRAAHPRRIRYTRTHSPPIPPRPDSPHAAPPVHTRHAAPQRFRPFRVLPVEVDTSRDDTRGVRMTRTPVSPHLSRHSYYISSSRAKPPRSSSRPFDYHCSPGLLRWLHAMSKAVPYLSTGT